MRRPFGIGLSSGHANQTIPLFESTQCLNGPLDRFGGQTLSRCIKVLNDMLHMVCGNLIPPRKIIRNAFRIWSDSILSFHVFVQRSYTRKQALIEIDGHSNHLLVSIPRVSLGGHTFFSKGTYRRNHRSCSFASGRRLSSRNFFVFSARMFCKVACFPIQVVLNVCSTPLGTIGFFLRS